MKNSRTKSPLCRACEASGMALAAVALLVAMPQANAESTLRYFTWGGYDDPAFRTHYTEKYGGGPEFYFYGHTDEAFAKLTSGFEVDIAHPCMHDVRKWKDAGLLAPVDGSRIAAWNDLIPALRDADEIVTDGQHWMVPWEWGSSSIIYRTDKVELPEESYAVLTDPAYAKRTAVPDAFDEIYQVSALLAGVKEPLNPTDDEFAAIEEQMRAIHANLRFIWSDPTQLEQAIASGEVVVAWGWPNSYTNLKQQGLPVNYMLQPKEGPVTWLCGFGIMANHQAPDEEVYDFINALTSPDAGKALLENFGYGHSNAKSLELVASERLAELGMNGDVRAFLAESNFLGAIPPEKRQRLIQLWEDVKLGN